MTCVIRDGRYKEVVWYYPFGTIVERLFRGVGGRGVVEALLGSLKIKIKTVVSLKVGGSIDSVLFRLENPTFQRIGKSCGW